MTTYDDTKMRAEMVRLEQVVAGTAARLEQAIAHVKQLEADYQALAGECQTLAEALRTHHHDVVEMRRSA